MALYPKRGAAEQTNRKNFRPYSHGSDFMIIRKFNSNNSQNNRITPVENHRPQQQRQQPKGNMNMMVRQFQGQKNIVNVNVNVQQAHQFLQQQQFNVSSKASQNHNQWSEPQFQGGFNYGNNSQLNHVDHRRFVQNIQGEGGGFNNKNTFNHSPVILKNDTTQLKQSNRKQINGSMFYRTQSVGNAGNMNRTLMNVNAGGINSLSGGSLNNNCNNRLNGNTDNTMVNLYEYCDDNYFDGPYSAMNYQNQRVGSKTQHAPRSTDNNLTQEFVGNIDRQQERSSQMEQMMTIHRSSEYTNKQGNLQTIVQQPRVSASRGGLAHRNRRYIQDMMHQSQGNGMSSPQAKEGDTQCMVHQRSNANEMEASNCDDLNSSNSVGSHYHFNEKQSTPEGVLDNRRNQGNVQGVIQQFQNNHMANPQTQSRAFEYNRSQRLQGFQTPVSSYERMKPQSHNKNVQNMAKQKQCFTQNSLDSTQNQGFDEGRTQSITPHFQTSIPNGEILNAQVQIKNAQALVKQVPLSSSASGRPNPLNGEVKRPQQSMSTGRLSSNDQPQGNLQIVTQQTKVPTPKNIVNSSRNQGNVQDVTNSSQSSYFQGCVKFGVNKRFQNKGTSTDMIQIHQSHHDQGNMNGMALKSQGYSRDPNHNAQSMTLKPIVESSETDSRSSISLQKNDANNNPQQRHCSQPNVQLEEIYVPKKKIEDHNEHKNMEDGLGEVRHVQRMSIHEDKDALSESGENFGSNTQRVISTQVQVGSQLGRQNNSKFSNISGQLNSAINIQANNVQINKSLTQNFQKKSDESVSMRSMPLTIGNNNQIFSRGALAQPGTVGNSYNFQPSNKAMVDLNHTRRVPNIQGMMLHKVVDSKTDNLGIGLAIDPQDIGFGNPMADAFLPPSWQKIINKQRFLDYNTNQIFGNKHPNKSLKRAAKSKEAHAPWIQQKKLKNSKDTLLRTVSGSHEYNGVDLDEYWEKVNEIEDGVKEYLKGDQYKPAFISPHPNTHPLTAEAQGNNSKKVLGSRDVVKKSNVSSPGDTSKGHITDNRITKDISTSANSDDKHVAQHRFEPSLQQMIVGSLLSNPAKVSSQVKQEQENKVWKSNPIDVQPKQQSFSSSTMEESKVEYNCESKSYSLANKRIDVFATGSYEGRPFSQKEQAILLALHRNLEIQFWMTEGKRRLRQLNPNNDVTINEIDYYWTKVIQPHLLETISSRFHLARDYLRGARLHDIRVMHRDMWEGKALSIGHTWSKEEKKVTINHCM